MKSVVMKGKLLLGIVLLFLNLPRLQADAVADGGACSVRRELPELPELRQPECRDAEAVRLIEMFYADYVFGGEDYAPGVEKYCTEKLIRWLKDDYTHEYDGAGYAVWNFRTGCQDGPGDVSQVVSVTALGNGLYAVKFIDMGIEGTRTVRVVCEDGGLKLDSVE